nr:carbamoyltransferase N-terminal domain-containing protein [Micromonospora sp. 4G55]
MLDGRGEAASHLAGVYRGGELSPLYSQELPHSLGLLYEDLTRHLGFLHSSDEYKVMALASYGRPKHLGLLRELVRVTDAGGFHVDRIDWASLAKAAEPGAELTEDHADLAASVQARLEEVVLDLARWLYDASGGASTLAMAGGVALNCVANARLAAEGPYRDVWVQPAAGDSGTALGAALHVAGTLGDRATPMSGADLGRGWSDDELEAELRRARCPTSGRTRLPPRRPGCSPPTASSPGTRGAASTARAPSGTARCWPTPATRRPPPG